jgi:hypothetical protein
MRRATLLALPPAALYSASTAVSRATTLYRMGILVNLLVS